MKILILGAGEVGFNIAKRFASENREVLVMGAIPEALKRVSERLDVQTMQGRAQAHFARASARSAQRKAPPPRRTWQKGRRPWRMPLGRLEMETAIILLAPKFNRKQPAGKERPCRPSPAGEPTSISGKTPESPSSRP